MSKTRPPVPVFQSSWLRERMRKRGVTVDQVAEQCDVNRATVNKWFAESIQVRSSPRAENLATLAIMLEVTMGACMGLELPRTRRYVDT